MACIMAEELRRRSLTSNSSVWSKFLAYGPCYPGVSFFAYLGETATDNEGRWEIFRRKLLMRPKIQEAGE